MKNSRVFPIPHIPLSKNKTVCFIDFETTDLLPYRGARITEFAAIKVSPTETTYFHSLAKPYLYSKFQPIELSPRIIELTKITNEMLENQRPTFEVFYDFLDFIGDTVCLAYNARFEKTFIDYYCSALMIDKDIVVRETTNYIWKYFGKDKLSNLSESSLAHSALDDSFQMLKLFKQCTEINLKDAKLCEITKLSDKVKRAILEDSSNVILGD